MTSKLKVRVGSCPEKGLKEENQDSLGHFVLENVNLLATKGVRWDWLMV